MSAEMLREAAGLMRHRATEALGPDYEWAVADDAEGSNTWWAFTDEDHMCANGILTARDLPQWTDRLTLFEHITGWSPAVALAVADWLDTVAARIEDIYDALPFSAHLTLGSLNVTGADQAHAVARAFLGSANA